MKGRFFDKNFLFILGTDGLLILGAWYFAHLLRFNFRIPPESWAIMVRFFPLILIVKLFLFYFFDLYRGMWRYTSLNDLINIIKASSTSSLFVVALIGFIYGFSGVARSVFIIDWVLTVFFISGLRVGIRIYFWLDRRGSREWRSFFHLFFFSDKEKHCGKRLIIVGAGDYGEKILREIEENVRLRYCIVGFVDDDKKKAGRKIHGIPVLGTTDELKEIKETTGAEEALIAIPTATGKQMRRIVSLIKEAGLSSKTVPGIGELINGDVSIKTIRDVAYKDLLGREVVQLDEGRIGQYLEGNNVLVTGGGGSIGSELCRQICRFKPKSVIIYEWAESALYDIDVELKEAFPGVNIIPFLGDICDRKQLESAFSVHMPEVVFHAAAYKHVPMMEMYPWKAVRNNVLGTRNMIDISKKYGIERFVFVSTDKAVRPVNVMGATKRVCELLVQGQKGLAAKGARFMSVRFGNVVGSVGSVIPLFKRQIERGGPVTVTHPEMIRYFMTIQEACQLILQAGAMGKGGEIFILDMGRPVKIADMARDLIRLSGLEPDVDIEIKYIGPRPGEKLYEELITEGEGIVPTEHEKIMVLMGGNQDQSALNSAIDELVKLAYEQDMEGIIAKLKEIVPEYRPDERTYGLGAIVH